MTDLKAGLNKDTAAAKPILCRALKLIRYAAMALVAICLLFVGKYFQNWRLLPFRLGCYVILAPLAMLFLSGCHRSIPKPSRRTWVILTVICTGGSLVALVLCHYRIRCALFAYSQLLPWEISPQVSAGLTRTLLLPGALFLLIGVFWMLYAIYTKNSTGGDLAGHFLYAALIAAAAYLLFMVAAADLSELHHVGYFMRKIALNIRFLLGLGALFALLCACIPQLPQKGTRLAQTRCE